MPWLASLGKAQAALVERPLRILIGASDAWTDTCRQDWGYNYHLERWFYSFLTEKAFSTRTYDPEEADYVYIPHCGMNVYLDWKQRRFLERLADTSDTGGSWHTAAERMHARALKDVDASYLADTVATAALSSAAVRLCLSRLPSCRLLLVNMAFGRNELPRFSARMGTHAVFVSTAGAVPRIGADFQPHSTETCACPLHCRPLRALGPHDIVVPYPISHNLSSGPAAALRAGKKRHILGFFIGSNTSCSRHHLFTRWANEASFRDHKLLVSSKLVASDKFERLARRSQFCLVVDGHWPSTTRLVAVMVHGCIPVVVSNRVELPFADLVEWNRASVLVGEGEIDRLPDILKAKLPDAPYMRERVLELAQGLDYYHTRFHILLLASLARQRENSVD
eukprot:TRINITY_DN75853_c0_g1_i1.p1 TRINITY_DN75853_c0_g1~~TRINITY_DN75853_c0_g1_i1.p1  ORF type:complete len:395 (-),score=60.21 TRINITY_DN75853_c0_g1_i1:111-1295(-)